VHGYRHHAIRYAKTKEEAFSAAISVDNEEFGAGLRRRAMRRIATF
jgi:hypothetical protein